MSALARQCLARHPSTYEVPQPMSRNTNGRAASSSLKRKDFGSIYPRHDVDRTAEDLCEPSVGPKLCPGQIVQLTSMYKKKNAIAADDVFWLPMLNRIVIIIMQKLSPATPQSIVGRRPIRSSAKAGAVLPTMNIRLTKPAIRRDVFLARPTFWTRTVGISAQVSQWLMHNESFCTDSRRPN